MNNDLQKLYGTIEALKAIVAALTDSLPQLQPVMESLWKELEEKQSMAKAGEGSDFIGGDVGLNAFINTLEKFLLERDEKRLSQHRVDGV